MTTPPSLRDRLLAGDGLLRSAFFRDLLHERFRDETLAPGDRVGPFRVVRELGRGGMGVVWLAERADGEFTQNVALKWLPDAAPRSESGALFRRERQFLAELSHPNIARLIDGGRSESGHLWFAMEYIEGLAIDRHVERLRLDERARIGLMLQVVDAVQFAHGRLLIHRDIKPGNVMVDGEGRPRLLDFGIAGFAQEHDAIPAFTPEFASPEQRALGAIGTASDIWQLGRLLDTVARAGGGRPSPDLRAIVAKATADDPAARYPSASSLRADLQRCLDRRPVVARNGGWTYRCARLAQRHPFGTVASMAVVAAALAFGIGFLRYAHVERERLRNARDETLAINRFLNEDVLSASDPFTGSGNDERLSDLLEDSIAKAERRFPRHPSTAGNILRVTADTLLNRGRYDAASRAAKRAIALLQSVPEPDRAAIGDARLTLALVDMYRGDYDRAQTGLAALERDFPFGAETPERLDWRIQSELAWNALLLNRYPDCADRYDRIVADHRGVDDRELAYAYIGLSECESTLGRFERALRHARIGERMAIAVGGEHSGDTSLARIRIAKAMLGLGEHAQAIAIMRREVDRLSRLLGPRHSTTVSHVSWLGSAYLCAEDNAGAIDWLRRAYAGRVATVGAEHPWTLITRAQYASALLRSGDMQRASAEFAGLEALRTPPAELSAQASVARALGEWRLHQSRPIDAIALFRDARRIAILPGMQVRANLHEIDAGLGLSLSQAGRAADAQQIYARMATDARDGRHCRSPLTLDAERDRQRLLAAQ